MPQIDLDFFLQIVRFGIAGIIGMSIDFSITWVLREKLKWNQYLANTCGFVVAVVNNYWINRLWTFKSQQNWLPEFGRFMLFSLVGLALNNALLYFFNSKLKIRFYLAKLMAIGCVFVWNFTSNKFLNFH